MAKLACASVCATPVSQAKLERAKCENKIF